MARPASRAVTRAGMFIALPLLAAFAAISATSAPASPDRIEARFERCSGSHRVTCVVDGDTIWLEGTKIRLSDINTPEVSQPGCAHERALAETASERLLGLLNQGPFSLARKGRDEDRYGRKLRVVLRGGTSLGEVLVAEGLAERWSGRRKDWCAA